MRLFLAGLLSGGLSGGGTYNYTGDTQIAVALGILAAVVAWVIGGIVIIVAKSDFSIDLDL